MLAVAGEMEIELTVAAAMVTVAVAVFEGSARLVTVIVAVPGAEPAVKTPAEVMTPEVVDHAIDLLVTVPCTEAVNCSDAPVRMLAVLGETVIEVTVGTLTVIVADADLFGSATLVALTVAVPAFAEAVKSPLAEIVPPVADQVTDLFVTVPCTDALNCCLAPMRMDGAAGDTETEFTTGAATVMVAVSDLVVSATLVAVIVAVPALADAVKRPELLMVPEEVFQVTDLFVVLPCTETESWSVAPVSNEADAGDTEIEDTATGAAVTVTLAEEDFVGSATLMAVMVAVPVFAGAVKTPEAEIVPVDAVQVTEVLVTVPWTEALKE